MYKIDKPFVMFIYGFPCSGKTTLAKKIKDIFGDEIEHIEEDNTIKKSKNDIIDNHTKSLIEIKNIDKSVVVSMVLTYNESRESNRKLLKDKYIQVYLDCPLSECERRDVEGLYKKSRFGKNKYFIGNNMKFEMNDRNDDVIINTEYLDSDFCINQILEFLIDKKFIQKM